LYVLAGAVAALLGAAVMRWFTRSAAITEVEVVVPQFSKVKFAVTKDHKVLAKRIVVQMTSRIAVRVLADDAGLAREALNSLHSLFLFVRDQLHEDTNTRSVPGRPKVNMLAMNMINNHLAPFLGHWHYCLTNWERRHADQPESDWPDNAKFRAELRALQPHCRRSPSRWRTEWIRTGRKRAPRYLLHGS
jgi:hypothetical protein